MPLQAGERVNEHQQRLGKRDTVRWGREGRQERWYSSCVHTLTADAHAAHDHYTTYP
jgi:hypothetical protein